MKDQGSSRSSCALKHSEQVGSLWKRYLRKVLDWFIDIVSLWLCKLFKEKPLLSVHGGRGRGSVWCHFLSSPMFLREGGYSPRGYGPRLLGLWSRGGGMVPEGYGISYPPVLTSSGGHWSGWYASYWNAFLFDMGQWPCKTKPFVKKSCP